jgi:hypothetical protein
MSFQRRALFGTERIFCATGLLLSVLLVAVGAAAGTRPAAEFLSPTGSPPVYVFRAGTDSKAIRSFDASKSKIRLAGFGITKVDAVRSKMRQTGSDVLIELAENSSLRVINTTTAALSDETFQVELDRAGLVQTFADEFDEFSWYAEGLEPTRRGGGRWKTNFGYQGVHEIGSRTLKNNGEQQIYSDPGFRGTGKEPIGLNPFRVREGVLEIVADRAPESIRPHIWNYQYTSGLITSKHSFAQLYGVFEMRARLPKGQGFWPCFWLLSHEGWPPEIDILEVLGHKPDELHTAWHSKATGQHTAKGMATHVPDTSADFHTYTVEWQRDEIRWYFDNVEVWRAPTPADMHKAMYILANLTVGGGWPGNPDAKTPFPSVMAIDWIRAYMRAPSPQ